MGRVEIDKLNSFILEFRRISERGKILVGLTGGIGSGKSTALSIFKKKGFHTVSSDDIVKKLLTQNYYCDIILNRYPFITDSCGRIDKVALARLIFNDVRAKRFVESVIHPGVVSYILKDIKNTTRTVVVVEVPLLFEVGLEKAFDVVLCVCCNRKIAEKRLCARGMTVDDIKARMRYQISDRKRIESSDIVIFNNDSFELFVKRIEEICNVFKLFSMNKIYKLQITLKLSK